MNYYTVSEDTWIPAAEDGAGTISCSGTIVTGNNTFFTAQIESGDWITNSGEARQVRTVNSDTDLELYKPFSSDFSGQAVSIIKEDNAKNLFLGIKNKSGAAITVDGESVPDGASVVKGQQNAPGYRRKFVEPVYVETTGTVLVNKQSITNRRVNATVPFIPGLFEPEYQAVLDYAATQAYTLPSAAQQELQNTLVVDLKAAGVWSKLGSFTMYATDGDFNFALIDWKRLVEKTAINSPIFSTNQGFTGTGTSKIDWGISPSGITGYSIGDASFGVGVLSVGSSGFMRYIGSDGRATGNGIGVGFNNKIINGTLAESGTTATVTGLIALTQNSTDSKAYYNGSFQNSVANSSGTVDTKNFTSFVVDGIFGTCDGTNQYEFAGLDLTTEMGDFETALNTYLTAI